MSFFIHITDTESFICIDLLQNFSELPRHCADQLIQDAIMYRFLVFRDQEKMTWKDQIAFTESMGDGNAHMETKSPGRKV